jgi:hypothetical protein
LRNYVDKLFSSTRRTRKRVQDNSRFAVSGKKAPVNAPRWTLTGYNGSLKSCIEKHIDEDGEDYVGDDEDDDEEDKDYVPPEASNKDENDDMDIDGEGEKGEKGGNEDEGGDEDKDGNRSDRSKSVVSEAYDYLSD